MIRLDPPLWLETPLGEAEAEFIIDRGPEHHLQFVCFILATGECWTFRTPEIRRATNVTMGRDRVSPFAKSTERRFSFGDRDHEEEADQATIEQRERAAFQNFRAKGCSLEEAAIRAHDQVRYGGEF